MIKNKLTSNIVKDIERDKWYNRSDVWLGNMKNHTRQLRDSEVCMGRYKSLLYIIKGVVALYRTKNEIRNGLIEITLLD